MKFVSLFLSILMSSTVLAEPDVDSLLHRSVGGSEAMAVIRGVETLTASGSVVLNGKEGRFTQLYRAPDKYYIEVDLGGFSLVEAFDGRIAWQKDINGGYTEIAGFARRELLRTLYFESFQYLLDEDRDEKRAYLGVTETPQGKFHEVAFFPFPDDTLICLFDLETGRRHTILDRVDQIQTVTTIGDYRSVGGLLLPYYTKVVAAEAGLVTEFRAERIELNGPIANSVFALPTDELADFHFPDDADSVQIPCEYVGGHIRLPVTISGRKKVWMILDSGASSNIFSGTALEGLDLPVVGSLPAIGIAGYEQVLLVKTDSVQIGRLTLYDQVGGSIDMGSMSERLSFDTSFGGILGYDFLSRFPVLIDFKNATITVFDPVSFTPPAGGKEVDFHLTMLIPTVYAEINGIGGDFILDLGNALGLVLHHRFVTENQLEDRLDDVEEFDAGFGGVGGSTTGRTAFAASFQMGEVLISSIRVLLPDSALGAAGSEELAGNIGNMVLENFRLLLDYRNTRLILYDTDQTQER